MIVCINDLHHIYTYIQFFVISCKTSDTGLELEVEL